MSAEKISILIVDDRPEGLMTLEAVLASPEYRLVKASSGEEALKCLLNEDFALILLDVQMPGMNGFETAATIRQRERSKRIPIIFITAINKDEKYVGQGYDLGAVDYLFKPLNPAILRSKVAVFVDLFRKTEQVRRQSELLRLNELRERERQIAELELESLRRYESLANAIPNLIWQSHEIGTVRYVNRSWSEFTGIGHDPSGGRGWQKAVEPQDLARLIDGWAKNCAELGSSWETEVRIRRAADGEYRWHLVRIFAESRDRHGKLCWLGTHTEIHERKEAEEERTRLLERERLSRQDAERAARRFQHLTELMPELVWEYIDGVTWVNRQWEDYTAASAPALLRKGWLEVFHPDDVQVTLEKLDAAIASEMPFSAEHRIRRHDGKYRWFLSKATPSKTLDGQTRWVGVSTDIQAFRDLDEQRADFLTIASHELKTPLTSMKTAIQMRLRALTHGIDVEPSRERKLLEIGARSASRLSALLDDLLDFSRVESGRLSVEPQPCDLSEVVREAAAGVSAEIAATGRLTLMSHVPDRVEGLCDAFRLRQVLDNLLGNAIKYSPERGTIMLTLERSENEAIIAVKDEGIGIGPEDQKRIFRAFERAVDQRDFGGFGIGLYVSSRIVHQHGGQLEVASEKGKGSTFIVKLPLGPMEVA